MKRTVTAFVYSVAIYGILFSALKSNAQLSGGTRAGINLSTTSKYAENLKNVAFARPYAGVFGQYNLKPVFALQLGINYSGEGAYSKEGSEKARASLAYMRIPLLAQYKLRFGGYIEGGPQLGWLLSAKERMNDAAATDVSDEYNKTVFGLYLAFGYELSKGHLAGLGANIHVMPDISKVSDDESRGKNNISFGIGLSYHIFKQGAL